MPTKNSADDMARPPLSRGSACHRCFARKVRCSGQPDPKTGSHACSSCLRTARFKNHDISQVKCAFNGEGLCSEEGGSQLNGEAIPSVAGPTRRKLASRTSTGSSNRSSSSRSSTASCRSDVSSSTSSRGTMATSPASSLESVPTLGKIDTEFPHSRPLFQQYSSEPFHSPPPPGLIHFTNLQEMTLPPPLVNSSSSDSSSSSTASSNRGSRSASPITPVDPPTSLLARRSGSSMQIALPSLSTCGQSRQSSFSATSSAAPSLDSAPLQTPASWGISSHIPPTLPHSVFGLLPPSQLPPFPSRYTTFTPSSFAKPHAAPALPFDFYDTRVQYGDTQVSTTVAEALNMDRYYASLDETASVFAHSVQYGAIKAAACDAHFATELAAVDPFSLDDPYPQSFSTGGFHVPSPGLPFASSTSTWHLENQYPYA
ncbi:hypothetical protein JCM16303_007273 [Sporobolomyces ruberrimus]